MKDKWRELLDGDDDEEGDELLDAVERRIADRMNAITSRLEGRQTPSTEASPQAPIDQQRPPRYGAEVHTPAQTPALRLRMVADRTGIECEQLQGGGPLAAAPEIIPIDAAWLSAVSLSQWLEQDSERNKVELLDRLARALTEVLPPDLRAALAEIRAGDPLTLRLDQDLLDIPWEFIAVPEGSHLVPLAHRNGIGRVVTLAGVRPARLPQTVRDRLSLLVLADPDCTLGDAGIDATVDVLRRELLPQIGDEVSFTVHRGPITKEFALRELRTNDHDVVFYMGHGCGDSPGFKFAGEGVGSVLTAAELRTLFETTNPPRIFFADACVSAAMPRGADGVNPLASIVAAMAQAGTTYVGTFWPIYGPAAGAFALGFLAAVFAGAPLGRAMLSGHSAYGQTEASQLIPCDDFAFCLYGDPATRIILR